MLPHLVHAHKDNVINVSQEAKFREVAERGSY
jgi:hypothetical protein